MCECVCASAQTFGFVWLIRFWDMFHISQISVAVPTIDIEAVG